MSHHPRIQIPALASAAPFGDTLIFDIHNHPVCPSSQQPFNIFFDRSTPGFSNNELEIGIPQNTYVPIFPKHMPT